MRLLPVLTALLLMGCSGQRALRQAAHSEQAGLLAEAHEAYLRLLEQKPRSAEARADAQRTAQRLLDDRLGVALMSYRSGQIDQGDRDRDLAAALQRAAAAKGLVLQWNDEADRARAEACRLAAQLRYEEAETAFRADRFAECIALAQQALQLDARHAQAPFLIRMAQAEPLYREAQKAEQLGLWRQAHQRYREVAAIDAAHKDVQLRLEHCRRQASYTLAYLPLGQGRGAPNILGLPIGSGPVDGELAALVQRELLALKDPYLQLIDRESTDVVMAEQRRQMSGPFQEQVAQAGRLLGARYLLTGRVLKYDDLLKRDLEVQVQLIDAQTGRIHLSEVVRAARTELPRASTQKLTDLVARRIAERLRGFEPKE